VVTHIGGASALRPWPRTLLLAVAADQQQAARAQAEGADLIDVHAATPGALAAIRASLPAAMLWTGSAADPVDADRLAAEAAGRSVPAGRTDPAGEADPAAPDPPAAVIAAAAICTWLGVPVIRSRHTRAVRRAIDMTASIAGQRPPSHTVRGLA
jgi:dihydropteroate synthase